MKNDKHGKQKDTTQPGKGKGKGKKQDKQQQGQQAADPKKGTQKPTAPRP